MKLQWSGRSGDEVSWLFMQVIIEVAVSLILCLWAALIVPGTFLPILPDSKENRFVYLVLNGHNLLDVNVHTYIQSTILRPQCPMQLNVLRIGRQVLLASHF